MFRIALLSVMAFVSLMLSACGNTPASSIEDFASSMGSAVIDVSPVSSTPKVTTASAPTPKRVEIAETQSVTVTEVLVQGQRESRISVTPPQVCKVFSDRAMFYISPYANTVQYIVLQGPSFLPLRSGECPDGSMFEWVE